MPACATKSGYAYICQPAQQRPDMHTYASLLNKGPGYNLHNKRPDWLTNLALEVETAIIQLLPPDRDFYRKQVAGYKLM
jgi:hypothetical protein